METVDVTVTIIVITVITTGVLFLLMLFCCLSAGVWRDRAGVQKKGVPYNQMRIVARAKWQLYHPKGVLERGGLGPHVVLAGDNSDMADAAEEEDLANAPPSHDKAYASSIHTSTCLCINPPIHPCIYQSHIPFIKPHSEKKAPLMLMSLQQLHPQSTDCFCQLTVESAVADIKAQTHHSFSCIVYCGASKDVLTAANLQQLPCVMSCHVIHTHRPLLHSCLEQTQFSMLNDSYPTHSQHPRPAPPHQNPPRPPLNSSVDPALHAAPMNINIQC